MIQVTRLDNTPMVVNVEMIRSLRATPDTVITFTTNDRMMVKEPVEEISKRILAYQRSIHSGAGHLYADNNTENCGVITP
jgi:flagellar protein FlbD